MTFSSYWEKVISNSGHVHSCPAGVCHTAVMTNDPNLPHWQLDSIFPGLDSDAYLEAKAKLNDDISALEKRFDEHDIRSGGGLELNNDIAELFVSLSQTYNDILKDLFTPLAYVTTMVSVDGFNEAAQAELSQLNEQLSQFRILDKRFTAWLGRLNLVALGESSDYAREHRYWLETTATAARHLMSDSAEALASALDVSGGGAWAKLHGDLTSRITMSGKLGTREEREYTLSELKILASDPSEAVRRDAHELELKLLEQNVLSYAAAMNSVKGQVNTLSQKRGWDSALAATLHDSSITAKALGALQNACEDSFPDFRRYLSAKAKFLGKDKLAWYDLFAPVSVAAPRTFSWQEAKDFVVDAFRTYSTELAEYAQMTFDQGWIDVPPRKGKRSGAYCSPVLGRQESRIMLNFGGTLDDVFTLAHELGHGYHNQQHFKANRDASQRSTPMTLAETASIFCETIVVNGMLSAASDNEQLAILEQDLLGATQLVVDIHSRFLFEDAVFEKRQQRELSVDELNQIMLDAQAQTYGDAVTKTHPMMWAQKGHYYSTGRSYYNFPYTFGYLFGLGIYASYQNAPENFQDKYNDLLSSTGMADAKTLAQRFGIDIEDKAFWESSLEVAKSRIEAYEQLVENRLASA